jgi:hypothetical protein
VDLWQRSLGERIVPLVSALVLTATACGSPGEGSRDEPSASPAVDVASIASGEVRDFGPAPDHPDGPWPPEVTANLETTFASLAAGVDPTQPLDALAGTGDPRIAWALADLQRFVQGGDGGESIAATIEELTGIGTDPLAPWKNTVEHLIAWDLPVPDEYFTFKRSFYSQIDPRWAELFSDTNTIDWRHVGWGGVLIDDRPAGSDEPCNCIPALDDPAVTPASEGGWYPDDRIVFGVVIGDDARAYPKNVMEVHEMVNDTVGGRRIGMPYCTLCGSAQAYFTDELGDDFPQPVFRTSGLLIRSNKMMYELNTKSFVDTFVGVATSGPLAEAGVSFDQVSVITTTWAEWKAEHPETTIVAEDGGIGRSYELDPLGGRDDDGPIFPIGDADARLPVQEQVLGIVSDSGQPIAFHVGEAREQLAAGERIAVDGIELELDGGGVRAVRSDGSDAGGHQAFWFAWSQFHPGTKLWPHDYQSPEVPAPASG